MSLVMNDTPKKKRTAEHLRKYHFGKGIIPAGKPKGTRCKKTELTAEILVDAFLTDPETAKKMSAKRLRYMLSKKIWKGSDKVLLDVIARKLGPVINTQQIVNLPTFNIIGIDTKAPEVIPHQDGGDNIETYTIPTPTVDTKCIEDKDKEE